MWRFEFAIIQWLTQNYDLNLKLFYIFSMFSILSVWRTAINLQVLGHSCISREQDAEKPIRDLSPADFLAFFKFWLAQRTVKQNWKTHTSFVSSFSSHFSLCISLSLSLCVFKFTSNSMSGFLLTLSNKGSAARSIMSCKSYYYRWSLHFLSRSFSVYLSLSLCISFSRILS